MDWKFGHMRRCRDSGHQNKEGEEGEGAVVSCQLSVAEGDWAGRLNWQNDTFMRSRAVEVGGQENKEGEEIEEIEKLGAAAVRSVGGWFLP